MQLPTVDAIAALPAGSLIIAAGGTALCHAALVARGRGVVGLFDAGPEVASLEPGDVVRLGRDGRWELSRPGVPAASTDSGS
ncbi:MAG: hypothetical protein R6X02_26540 [Enhygromyxa sp.]